MNQTKDAWYDGWLYAWFYDPVEYEKRKIISGFIDNNAAVVDVCCGTGALVLHLADKCKYVTGVDRSVKMFSCASRKQKQQNLANVSFLLADVRDLATVLDRCYDFAVLSLALHEMTESTRYAVLDSISQVAKRVIVADFAAPQPKSVRGAFNIAMERIMGGKENYQRFCQFLETGGVAATLQKCGYTIYKEEYDAGHACHFVGAERKTHM